jgi:hypothetical protein
VVVADRVPEALTARPVGNGLPRSGTQDIAVPPSKAATVRRRAVGAPPEASAGAEAVQQLRELVDVGLQEGARSLVADRLLVVDRSGGLNEIQASPPITSTPRMPRIRRRLVRDVIEAFDAAGLSTEIVSGAERKRSKRTAKLMSSTICSPALMS